MYLPSGTRLGRYQIEAPIGAGGMGEVYRAIDTRLDRSVAVKILSSRLTLEPNAKQRFEREAHAASALNHPHICTIHDVGEHDGQQFLVMELLEGVTLKQYMEGQALAIEQVLKLGIQIADALQAAHNKGVIHRDVKPANVFVTKGGEVKVLDFGLAKLLPPGDRNETLSLTLTEPQAVLGTLPYMAPEQLRGEQTDARTDIWGVGAVLYQMATGHQPFREELATRLTDSILHEPPTLPRALNNAIPAEMERIILKCLEKDPENRYQSAKELVVDLRRFSSTAATTLLGTVHRARRRAQMLVGLMLLALVGVLTALNVGGLRERLLHVVRPSRNAEAVALAPNSPRAVAVIGFKNLSGRADEAWLSTAFSEMLTSELAAGGDLRTIPGEDVARMKIELSLPDSESYSHETLARIRKDIGTDLVLVGSYLDIGKDAGGKIRLDLRLQDAVGGETLAVLTETGTEAEMLDLVSRTGVHLREKLGVGELVASEVSDLKASYPANPEAARYYAEGLARLHKYDALAARPLLEKAVAADANYALAYSALSEAWSKLGYDTKAATEAKHAFDLSQRLFPEEKLEVEGRYRETTHEWDKAVEIYRRLWASPDKLKYGLRLADAQYKTGKPVDALATVEALRKLPPPARDDPRIDLSESQAAGALGDFTRVQGAAKKAASKAEAKGARILFANARAMESWGLGRLDKMEEARAALEDVKRVASETGDRRLFARMLGISGDNLGSRGDSAGAARAYEEALANFEEIGDKSGVARALWAIAGLHENKGDFAEAESRYRQSLAAYQDIAERRSSAGTLEIIGWTIFCRGDLAGAQRKYEESRSILREIIGYDYRSSWLGDKQASVLTARDNLEGAKKLQEESLEAVKRLENPQLAAQLYSRLAETLLEQEHASDAVQMAASAMQEAKAARDVQLESVAHAVLAEALLAQGNIPEAKKEIAQALSRVAEFQWWHRMRILVIAARVHASSRQSSEVAEASHDLRAVLEEAKKKNTPQIQFEARLAMGEIELESGNREAGSAELATLTKDAQAKGFRLIARKASTMLAKYSCRESTSLFETSS